MSLFKVFDISGSGMVAQSQRLNVVASNLANADAMAGPDGRPYKARQVMFRTADVGQSGTLASSGSAPQPPILPMSPNMSAAGSAYIVSSSAGANVGSAGVRVAGVVEDNSPGRRSYDPKHPLADAQGYVTMPNVNVVEEMVNMISASRSYQSNAEVMNTAKSLLLKTLSLGS